MVSEWGGRINTTMKQGRRIGQRPGAAPTSQSHGQMLALTDKKSEQF
jgi:hypothetical protein